MYSFQFVTADLQSQICACAPDLFQASITSPFEVVLTDFALQLFHNLPYVRFRCFLNFLLSNLQILLMTICESTS